jgi:uncharacterized membrane protein
MEFLYPFLIVIVVFFVLPIIAITRVSSLSSRVKALEDQINELLQKSKKPAAAKQEMPAVTAPVAPKPKVAVIQKPLPEKKREKPRVSFEQQIGSRIFVWLAGISLALAAVFLVKYSIEKELLSPMVRLMIAGLFGLSLIGVAELMRLKGKVAYNLRLSQSLFGAGIIALYGVLFAAANIYHLMSPLVAFLGMAVVTIVAVVASLRHGMPIAVLGLIGGFVTPMLIQTQHPSAFGLFAYLYLLFLGMIMLARKVKWLWLVPAAYLAAVTWKVIWVSLYFDKEQALWGSLFLVLISFSLFFYIKSATAQFNELQGLKRRLMRAFAWVAMFAATLLLGIDVVTVDFDLLYWGLFLLLSLASIVYAYYDEDNYGFLPAPVLLLSFLLYYIHPLVGMTPVHILAAMVIVFVLIPYVLMKKMKRPELMAAVSAVGAVVYFILAYNKLSHFQLIHISQIWWITSLALGFLSIWAVKDVKNRFANYRRLEWLLAIFAMTASAFIAIAFCLYFENKFLVTALFAEGLAVAWIATRYPIKILPYLSFVFVTIAFILLLPQVLEFVEYAIQSFWEDRSYTVSHAFYLLENPLFYASLPAGVILLACILLKQKAGEGVVRFYEFVTLPLFTIGCYLFLRKVMAPEAITYTLNVPTFFERALTLNLLLGLSFAGFKYASVFGRIALRWSGTFLLAIALIRIAYIELLTLNPMRVDDNVGSWPVINYLLVMYAAPIGWFWLISKENVSRTLQLMLNVLQFGFFFAWISLNIRQLYHGAYMATVKTTELELYTYSVVWGVMGVALLVLAILTRSLLYRYASLIFIGITIAKVFMYDISKLEGLYRVLSFLVLGFVLIGISYVYSRYVFQKTEGKR